MKSYYSSVQNLPVVPHPTPKFFSWPKRSYVICISPLLVPLCPHYFCSTLTHCIPATRTSAYSWTFKACSCLAAFALVFPLLGNSSSRYTRSSHSHIYQVSCQISSHQRCFPLPFYISTISHSLSPCLFFAY